MNLVKIIPFEQIRNDERGLTASFKLCRQQDDFIFITRKAQSISGNTYHNGLSKATNPKVFVLLDGVIKLSYRKIGTDNVYENLIKDQSIIEISPQVTHQIEAITDIIVLECNSIDDIANDRARELVHIVN